ncbi:hypothetical protein ABXT00_09020 [Stenotrophomonas koreensis]|uniref:hypothetical protein n=1 Tax=Stenotrophomonas koreensis TaxID=266128 RepID=UPI0033935281
MKRFYGGIEQIEENGKVSTYVVDKENRKRYQLTIEMIPFSAASASEEISAGIRKKTQ